MFPRVSSASVPLIPSCPNEKDRLLVHAWVMILPGKRDVSYFPPSTINISTQQPQRVLTPANHLIEPRLLASSISILVFPKQRDPHLHTQSSWLACHCRSQRLSMSSRQQASNMEYKMHHIMALSRSGITKTCGQNCGLALRSWMAAAIAQPLGTWLTQKSGRLSWSSPAPRYASHDSANGMSGM